MKPVLVFIFILFAGVNSLFSQEQQQIDSVKNLISKLNSDTALIRNYLVLAEWVADLDEWSGYNNKALEIINKIYDNVTDKKQKDVLKLYKANGLNNLGLYYKEKNDYDAALEKYEESLKLQRELHNTEGEAVCLVNISAIEISRGNSADGIAKNVEALKIFRDVLHDKSKTATVLANIGHEYMGQGNTQQAINYYNQALEIHKEANNQQGVALVYSNFGHLYSGLDDHKTAFDYYNKACELYIKQNDRRRIAKVYLNMSFEVNHLDKKISYKYDSLALDIYSKLDDKEGLARCYHNIGKRLRESGNFKLGKSLIYKALQLRLQLDDANDKLGSALHMSLVYIASQQLDSAEYWAKQGENFANLTGYNVVKRDAALALSKVYEAKKDFEKAYRFFKKYKTLSDSVINSESKNAATRQLSKIEYEKREVELKAAQEKEELILKGELGKQQVQRNAFLIGFAAVSILLFFVFKNYNEKKKANQVISEQKEIVEEKNKEITDSINYAKRIQEAVLPAKEIKYKIFPNAFVLFQPRDIVSGDFYWFTEKNGKRLIAAVDCTGHGVPGAFMSLIGNTFLNEIVNVKGITDPAEILNHLREQIIHSLKQSGGENKDGMDISILCFDDKKNSVEYAGANNPLWLIRGNECVEYKANKQPIGYYLGEPKPFSNNQIQLQKNDILYIFTDGFADQFGGPKGKKFKYKNLKEFLIAINDKSMSEQEDLLIDKFSQWKAGLEQVDDVCIIGIKV